MTGCCHKDYIGERFAPVGSIMAETGLNDIRRCGVCEISRCLRGAFAALLLSACSPTSPSDRPLLRLTNTGAVAVENVTVLFPDDRIAFGPVPAGATTEYRPASNGVYGYAAFEFAIGGARFDQPVIDWVGEQPLHGAAFTYTIEVTTRATKPFIELRSVSADR